MSSGLILYDSSWITPLFIQDRLRKYYKDSNLTVENVIVKSASGAGDGYGGIILRVFVHTTKGSQNKIAPSYIVKTLVWNDLTTKTQKKYNILQKELDMYRDILPRIKHLLVGIGGTSDVFPDTISVDSDLEVMVIEDLQVKKYVMMDRLKGVDREHLLLFMESLAKVHAASAVLYEKDATVYQKCPFGMFSRETDVYHAFFYNFWDAMCDEVARWFGYSYYAEKLKAIREHLIESACRVYDNDNGDFCVLTHGDMWINNVMFKHGPNGVPQDAVMYDYQYAYYGSPFIDIILFIQSSTDDSVHLNHDEYIHHYYKALHATLKRLNFNGKVSTLFEFRQQYVKKSFLKLTSTLLMTPIMTNECGDMADLEALLLDDERARKFRKMVYQRPKLVATIKKLLPVFDRLGLLDPMY